MIGIGIAGYGYWGPNLARAFAEAGEFEVRAICDASPERLADAGRRFPVARLSSSYRELLAEPEVDAVVIATPVATHFPLAMQALRSGRHVFIEKPMVENSIDAADLIEEAARRQLTLMVDYPYLFSPAFRAIAACDLGELYYYDSVRVNLGRFQPDVNVLWDLAAHDLSILDRLTGKMPESVSATGIRHFPGEPHDQAYLTLFYPGSLIAHMHVSWVAPVKLRRTLIGGSRRMIVYDDLEPAEKVRIYDNGVEVPDPAETHQRRIGYRTGDLHVPRLPVADALEAAARHFGECIRTGARPLTDGEAGLRIVRLLESATESMQGRGRPVPIGENAVAYEERT